MASLCRERRARGKMHGRGGIETVNVNDVAAELSREVAAAIATGAKVVMPATKSRIEERFGIGTHNSVRILRQTRARLSIAGFSSQLGPGGQMRYSTGMDCSLASVPSLAPAILEKQVQRPVWKRQLLSSRVSAPAAVPVRTPASPAAAANVAGIDTPLLRRRISNKRPLSTTLRLSRVRALDSRRQSIGLRRENRRGRESHASTVWYDARVSNASTACYDARVSNASTAWYDGRSSVASDAELAQKPLVSRSGIDAAIDLDAAHPQSELETSGLARSGSSLRKRMRAKGCRCSLP